MIDSKTLLLLASSLFAIPLGAQTVTHRWNFNSTGPSTHSTIIPDQISAAPGTIVGINVTRTGTALTLPGGSNGQVAANAIAGYFDLPNGIISSKTNFTVEMWATIHTTRQWQRVFDFGRVNITANGNGEISNTSGNPGGAESRDNLMLSAQRGDTLNDKRLAARNDGAGELGADNSVSTSLNVEYHYVATYQANSDPATGGRFTWFRNGTQMAAFDTNFPLNQLQDVNNWLGRSQWTGDQNSNISYNEFRLYDYALTPAQIAASAAAGPDLSPAPVAVADAISMHRGQKARIGVLANDSNVQTFAITQAPAFGTATVTPDRKILYTHTTGSPTGDTLTYQITSFSGQTASATVTINFAESLRLANPNLNVPANPPPTGIGLVDALPGLTFDQPVCLRTPPGETERLFICEKTGRLKVIPDITAPSPVANVVINLSSIVNFDNECGLLSVAFHPQFATNRYFYVFYSHSASGLRQRVSRFTMDPANPNAVLAGSERILIDQIDDAGNHNGGDMHFGPDGYLYISTGDEGNGDDTLNNSQTLTKDIFSAILRIDVNLERDEIVPGNPAEQDDANLVPQPHPSIPLYSGKPAFEIPVDNPYVHTGRGGNWNGMFNGSPVNNLAAVRDEFWAVGLRNPWRMSFDTVTGELWCGDVGQNVLEEIDIIVKGGNYGWAFREANNNGPKSGQAPTNFDTLYHNRPIYQYDRNTTGLNGYSVTGGLVYRGNRISSLTGKYIFADYGSGNIWSLLRNGTNSPTVERISGEGGIVGFGTDPSNQDVLLADINGRVLRLVSTTPTGSFPPTLTATGLFADLSDLSPAPGLLPYSVNLPFWSDHAEKSRWFIIPDGTSSFGWAKEAPWSLPAGTIWVKHFDMEMQRGIPSSKKRIETRIIVRNSGGVYGVSYRWNEAGTEAFLANDAGENFVLAITDGGNPAPQTWRIPSRSECLTCHTPQGGYALSFNTRQLNLEQSILGHPGNQLDILSDNAFFSGADPGPPNLLPRHLRPDESEFSVEGRVRSYLAVNCAYCHQSGGTAPSSWDGSAELTLDQTGLILGSVNNDGGDPANKLVVPGSPVHSVILNRVAASNGFTRMPPLGSNVIDDANVDLLTEWITGELVTNPNYAAWRLDAFGSSDSPEGAPDQDPDNDGMNNASEFLAGTLPQDGSSTLIPQVTTSGGQVNLSFNLPTNRSFIVRTSTDLGQWTPWDIPGNQALPVAGGLIELTAPQVDPARFFRIEIRGN
ncbi:MAG: PQQ-dependent sugar dehydrogenase [Verrucomicrobiota bacterium]